MRLPITVQRLAELLKAGNVIAGGDSGEKDKGDDNVNGKG